MGPLGFSEGSHRQHMGRNLTISQESEDEISRNLKDRPYACLHYQLGDLSFHYGFTMHNAGPNTTSKARRVMTIIYMDVDMKVAQPKNRSQHHDMASWLSGRQPGDPFDSPINPILFEAIP